MGAYKGMEIEFLDGHLTGVRQAQPEMGLPDEQKLDDQARGFLHYNWESLSELMDAGYSLFELGLTFGSSRYRKGDSGYEGFYRLSRDLRGMRLELHARYIGPFVAD